MFISVFRGCFKNSVINLLAMEFSILNVGLGYFSEKKCNCVRCQMSKTPLQWLTMSICPICGNKRCAKADDHNNECSFKDIPGYGHLMIVYISGPMTGIKDFNHPAFFEAEEQLKKCGHVVINPARNPHGLKYENYMDISLAQIRACEALCRLPGDEYSKGAICERSYAISLSKKIYCIEEFLNK